jgi:hypothetical protein
MFEIRITPIIDARDQSHRAGKLRVPMENSLRIAAHNFPGPALFTFQERKLRHACFAKDFGVSGAQFQRKHSTRRTGMERVRCNMTNSDNSDAGKP